jgi:site-specific recombinase XerC
LPKESTKKWLERLTTDERTALTTWRREHRWHPNQLRHTSATIIRKEYGIEAARAIIGHSRMTTTEVYAEIDRIKAAGVMAKIG